MKRLATARLDERPPGASKQVWKVARAIVPYTQVRSCGTAAKPLESCCLSAHSYKAQTPACHRTHLRTARRVWRTVVRATHTPSILVLPGPQPTAICVTMSSGRASGAGVMACADVATVKAKPATAINLSIVLLPSVVDPRRSFSRLGRDLKYYWQTCIRPSSSFTMVPGVHLMPLRAE